MKKAAASLLALLTVGVTAAGAAEFWDKKKFTQWSEKEIRKMLTDSPWTQDFEDTDVHIDPLQSPSISAGPPTSETGAGAPETGDTDVGLRARQPIARMVYKFQIRSALPIRQALVRSAQLRQDYEHLPAEQKLVFDQQAERFLAETFSDRVVIYVTCESNIDFDQRELIRYWRTQTTDTLKNNVYLIGGKGRKAELREFAIADESGKAFQFTFPRTMEGAPLVGPEEKSLQLEFKHPDIRGRGERRVLVEFPLKKMLMDGQLEY